MKRTLLSLAAAGVFAIASSASAENITFTFQPCGNNSCAIAGLTTLDWQPGNVLALGGAGGGQILAPGTKITDYYQANLNGALNGASQTLFSQGSGGVYLTVVAGFGEQVLPFPFSSGVTNGFTFDPTNQTNFFRVYLNSTGGTNLTGANFASGTAIIEGYVTAVQSSVSATLASTSPTGGIIPVGNFDQFDADGAGGNPANDYPGVTSIGVTGSADVWARITNVNSAYFPDLLIGDLITAAFTTGNLLAPFATVDPSSHFSSDGINSANYAHNIGAVNGITGPNFQFQADTSTTFERSVPEPGSIALLGLALMGAAGAVRRKRSA